MSMITNSARFLLFSPKQPANVTIESIVMRKASNVVRRMFGMPPSRGPGFRDWLLAELKKVWAELVGEFFGQATGNQLPDGFPVRVWETIDNVLRTRGGFSNKEQGIPNYWLSRSECQVLPHIWKAQIEVAPTADPGKISAFEESIEDTLAKAGYDLNIRFQFKPLCIQIDRPNPEPQTLTDWWPFICTGENVQINAFWTMPAVTWNNRGATELIYIDMASTEGFGQGDFSASGGGKSQLALSKILSAAMLNSPERLCMIVIDPKGVDFPVLGGLPHLALPVICDAGEGIDALKMIVAEMDRRVGRAKAGERDFPRILLFVDELADLLMVGGDEIETALVRLAQKGRALGISLILSSQRATSASFPANILNNLPCRWVGRMGSAGESVFASGQAGSTTHRLPGRGAFEVYNPNHRGDRVQAFFVADPKSKTYARDVHVFIDDIKARWGDVGSHWTPLGTPPAPTLDPVIDVAPDASEPAQDASDVAQFDDRFFQALENEYKAGGNKLSQKGARRAHVAIYGTDANPAKAKAIIDRFTVEYERWNAVYRQAVQGSLPIIIENGLGVGGTD